MDLLVKIILKSAERSIENCSNKQISNYNIDQV